jgi:hypothetical protein
MTNDIVPGAPRGGFEMAMQMVMRTVMTLVTTLALGFASEAIPQQKDGTHSEFTVVLRGDGKDPDGFFVALTIYEGPPGFKLSQIHRICATEREAHEHFERRIKRFKVILREPKKDKAGKVVGERAEVLLIQDGDKPLIPEILFTVGSNYLEISSASRDENLELEKFLSP